MTYRLCDKVLCQELDGETVLLHLVTEQYHQLNPMGTEMLSLVQTCDEAEVVQRLLERYEVPADRLCKDVAAFLEGMTRRGLLEPV